MLCGGCGAPCEEISLREVQEKKWADNSVSIYDTLGINNNKTNP